MGRISFAIAEAAREAGAQLATGVPVARIVPGEGVELESGELIRARAVVSNADPEAGPGDARPRGAFRTDYRERLEGWKVRSPVVKLNAALSRLPTFTAAGSVEPHRAMVTVTRGLDAAQEAFEACERGEPSVEFAELYFQTAYDPTVAPPGAHDDERLRPVRALRARRGRLGEPPGGDRRSGPRPDRGLRARRARMRGGARGARARPTSRRGSASAAATSSRGRRCRSRCGTGGSITGRRSRASTSAAQRPTRRGR